MRLGLLVGANGYDQLAPLKFGVKDALSLREVLIDKERGAFDERFLRVLVDGDNQPIKAIIVDNLDVITSKAGKDDEIIFYFSGHGFEVEGTPFLAPLDTRLNRADETAIPLRRVREMFDSSAARTKVLILDACYSGLERGKAGAARMSKSFESELREMASKARGTVILTSCSSDEASWEDDELGNGVFTHFLVEGLRGNADADRDGDITVSELYSYVRKRVDEHSIKTGNKQTPNFISSMAGDVVLVRMPKLKGPEGSVKATGITLSKNGSTREVADYEDDTDAQKAASSDSEEILGKLGATLADLYGHKSLVRVGSEFKFPDGSYSAGWGGDEKDESYSSWCFLKAGPSLPDAHLSRITRSWKPDRIEVTTQGNLDLDISYDHLKSAGFTVNRFVPNQSIEASNGSLMLVARNLGAESSVSLTSEADYWNISGISNFGLSWIMSLVS